MTGWASESFINTQALKYPKQQLWHFYKNPHPGLGCDRSALPVCITIWSSLCLRFILCVRFVSRCDDIAPCSCVSSERQTQLAAENIKQVYPHLNTPPVFANFGEKYYWANFFSPSRTTLYFLDTSGKYCMLLEICLDGGATGVFWASQKLWGIFCSVLIINIWN